MTVSSEASAPATHGPLAIDIAIPLAIDLDGTLILTDSLVESCVRHCFLHPLAALRSLPALAQGWAAFKRRVVEYGLPDLTAIPQRRELIDILRAERARGRKLHLVTAADQKVADMFAEIFGFFDTARGSDGRVNLKGTAKREFLLGRFAEGFVYAGDNAVDLPVFAAARGAILCDVDAATAAAVGRAGTPILADLRRPARGFAVWLQAIRAVQYSKNVLIFVPLIVGHAFGNIGNIVAVSAGFLIFCAMASGTYIVNDLADLDADRRNRVKRNRPFASGAIPVACGLAIAPLMILASLVAAYLLSPGFALALVAYLALTLAYSFRLKRVALLDVFVIGVLFTLRIVAGAAILGPEQSPWLLAFALSFFISLATAKRHCEIMRADHAQLDEIAGRGYLPADWPLTLTFGIGTGLVSVLIMLLYLANDATPSGFYNHTAWLYAIPALVSLWLMRIWLLSNRMILDEDPVVFALKDPTSLALGVTTVVCFILAL